MGVSFRRLIFKEDFLLKSEILKKSKMEASAILLFVGAIATASNFALAKGPDADSCYRYNVGAHATQGGGGPKEDCSGDRDCYIARLAKDNEEKQDLSATQDQFVGGCAAADDPLFHSGINKDKAPSCSEKLHNGKDLICLCNEDDCNKKDKIPEMTQKKQSLGSYHNGSENVGYSLFLTVSALLATIFFRA